MGGCVCGAIECRSWECVVKALTGGVGRLVAFECEVLGIWALMFVVVGFCWKVRESDGQFYGTRGVCPCNLKLDRLIGGIVGCERRVRIVTDSGWSKVTRFRCVYAQED